MSRRREVAVVLGVAALGALLLLLAEPATGLVVLAGAGAASLVGPRARVVVSVALLLVGLAVVVLATSRSDALLAAGGVLVTVAGSAAAVRVRRWPPPRRGGGGAAEREPTARDTWEALDRGEDPTA